jgi:hypothetical protein
MPPDKIEEVQAAAVAEWGQNQRSANLKKKLIPMDAAKNYDRERGTDENFLQKSLRMQVEPLR